MSEPLPHAGLVTVLDRRVRVALLALTLAGCMLDRSSLDADPVQVDAGLDAGAMADSGVDASVVMPMDAAIADSGSPDAGLLDSGHADSGPPDAGPLDAGTEPLPELGVTRGLLYHFDAMDVLGDKTMTPADGENPGTWVNLTGGPDANCVGFSWNANGLGTGLPAMVSETERRSRCRFSIPDLTDLTVFVVLRTADTRESENWWTSPNIVGADRNGQHNDASLFLSGGKLSFARRDAVFRSELEVAHNTPHLIWMVRVSESGNVTLGVDGVSAMRTVGAGPITEPDRWSLGQHEVSTESRINASYAEVLIYNRALNAEQLDEVREYLRARWRL